MTVYGGYFRSLFFTCRQSYRSSLGELLVGIFPSFQPVIVCWDGTSYALPITSKNLLRTIEVLKKSFKKVISRTC